MAGTIQQTSRPNAAASDRIDRTNLAAGETSARRMGPVDCAGADFHRMCCIVPHVFQGSLRATGRHWRWESMLNYVGRVTAAEKRNREIGDLEGRWEWLARGCFAGLLDTGRQHDDCSAVCHTALLVEETAVLHQAHVCGCWPH